jgi:hypothetical protein
MKDIILLILFILLWKSEVHANYPNLIPALLVFWVVIVILEIIYAWTKS